MGEKGFVSLVEWPQYDGNRVDPVAEESEALIKSSLEDTLSIIRATKITPKRVYYYTAAPWRWEAYRKALSASLERQHVPQSDLMKELMKDEDMKKIAKSVARFVADIVDEINRIGKDKREKMLSIGAIDEAEVLKQAEDFLQRELNAEIRAYVEDDPQLYDPKNRAQLAKPYRPAIYIE
jgi:leucyl-tRNA synthetase